MLLDPVTLPCCGGNMFDRACISKHLEANRNVASCPICRKALATLPPVGVETESGLRSVAVC